MCKINGMCSILLQKAWTNYHKGIGNQTSFWQLSFFLKIHLPCLYNREYYKLIKAFQGEKVVNVPLHAKDVNVEGDGITYHLHQGHNL